MKFIIGAGISLTAAAFFAILMLPLFLVILLGIGVPLLIAGICLAAICSGLLLFIFWLWMLIDAIRNRGLSEGEKVGWVIAITFLHFLAAIPYFIFGHPKRKSVLPA